MRHYPAPPTAERHSNGPCAACRSQHPKRSLRPGLAGCAALVAGALASTVLGAPPAPAAASSTEQGAAALAPGTIFVANAGSAGDGTGKGSVTAYPPGATGNARPIVLITAGINGPQAVAFDPSGDLWVANSNNTVVEYSKAELTKASPSPTVTISSPNPLGPTLDPAGDMWLVNNNPNTGASVALVEFTKAQLAKSGSPKPVVSIANLNLCDTAFDPSGDLWAGSLEGGSTLYEFTKAQLAKSGSSAPRVTITSHGLDSPCRPVFDRSGDLWVGNYSSGTVVEFTKAQLAKSGSQAPRVTLSSDDLSQPGDIAVDASGDLWVPNGGDSTLSEFTKAQLAKSGSQAPANTIAGPATGLNVSWSVAFLP